MFVGIVFLVEQNAIQSVYQRHGYYNDRLSMPIRCVYKLLLPFFKTLPESQ